MTKSFPVSDFQTIEGLVSSWSKKTPGATALAAPEMSPITYSGLDTQLRQTCQWLRECGLGADDTVALVLPNGPEAAVATLAAASVARCAPLNPGFRAGELNYYLDDLKVKSLILDAEIGQPLREIAQSKGIHVIELDRKASDTAGVFSLGAEDQLDTTRTSSQSESYPSAGDIALLLHTSGTTSRPKIVPLTHRNLHASVLNISKSLQLSPKDCCMNVMPLFHVHGLVANVFSSLHAGSRIVCCPDFISPLVVSWLQEFGVTWYSAVPTVHKAVLERARRQEDSLDSISLRFIRSASAALSADLLYELEKVFNAPVIEAYGMTEAAHQITTNPLPPDRRKPGSVGRSAGTGISIVSEDDDELPENLRGEILIHGSNVITGYLHNKDANQRDFSNGWLRTGDQGYIDEDGYLFLTGRLKEMINRGGEKIAPREIDEILLLHPSVSQAVTFALPDDQLGEEVAAAVIANPGSSVRAEDLREFVSERLADFKVPRYIEFVDKIPTSPTGKIQRIGLADRLSLVGEPRAKQELGSVTSQTEEVLQRTWCEVLALDAVESDANFFALGGDSVLAGMVISRVNKAFDIELNAIALFNTPTVSALSSHIDAHCLNKTPKTVESGGVGERVTESDDQALIEGEQAADNIVEHGMTTGHQMVATMLKQLGVSHVYGLTGTPVNETFAECAKAGIRLISVHNQSAGAQMAAAQNYIAGRLVAATMMTPGPGMANAAMGTLVAKDNGWPLLLIGGGRPQELRLAGVFQDFDSVSMYRPITKMSAIVESIHRLPWFLQKAVTVSVNGKPGPVYLDIPEDVLTSREELTSESVIKPINISKSSLDPGSLEAAAKMLGDAERPVLLLDMEVRWGMEDFSLLKTFVDDYQCPFATTHMTRGYLSDEDPLCCNRLISQVCKGADLVLLIGGKLDWQFRFGSEINPDAKILQVCMEAEDVGIGRNPELAIIGSPSEILRQLNGLLIKGDSRPERSAWINRLKQIRHVSESRIADLAEREDIPMIPERLMAELKPCIPKDAVVIADGNACYGAVQRLLPALWPLTRLTPGPDGCIGVGIPYGIGVKLEQPERPVIIITGDTAFGFGVMEIETAVRHRIDLVIIVANNSSPSAGKAHSMYPKQVADEVAMYQHNLPFHMVAKSLGASGENIDAPEQIKGAMERAFKAGGVTCINVEIAAFTPIKLR